MKNVVVKQEEGAEIATEIIAGAIVELSAAMKRINEGRLTRKALVVLLAHSTGLGHNTIQTVLVGLESLEQNYVKAAAR